MPKTNRSTTSVSQVPESPFEQQNTAGFVERHGHPGQMPVPLLFSNVRPSRRNSQHTATIRGVQHISLYATGISVVRVKHRHSGFWAPHVCNLDRTYNFRISYKNKSSVFLINRFKITVIFCYGIFNILKSFQKYSTNSNHKIM